MGSSAGGQRGDARVPPERGAWLTLVLVALTLNQVLDIGYFGSDPAGMARILRFSLAQVYGLLALEIAEFIAVFSVWLWSRSGLVAYVALSVGEACIQLARGRGIALLELAAVGLLVALLRRHWRIMPWGIA